MLLGNFTKCRNLILLLVLLFIGSSAKSAGLSPGLQLAAERLHSGKANDSLVEVVIFLDDFDVRESVSKLSQTPAMTRSKRIKAVVSELKSASNPYKRDVMEFVRRHAAGEIQEHWIVPAIRATLPLSKLGNLSEHEGVQLIVENVRLVYESPVEATPALSTTTTGVSDQLNLLKIPQLWAQGLKGKGRLVCSFDTGVEQSHPALASKWRGNHSLLSSAWFSKVSPDTLPYDLIGHGTHTMGVMVGAAEADSFGVAPEAEWITAGVIDQGRTLSMTLSDIIEAFQWTLNPDNNDNTTDDVPDVILNSWGIPKGLFSPCDGTFWGMIDAVEAAGIVTIFSAGNEGPDPQTIRSPADRASTPINAFAIGAVDNSMTIAAFSSRGPSSCDNSQIKPEAVAPGVNIRSSYKDGGYYLMSGTSMAAPYIAGLVALIRQYNPDATVEQIKYAFLQATIDLGPDGEDNAYGYGFIDAARVLDYIPLPLTEGFDLAGFEISGDGIAFPGETFGLNLVLRCCPDAYEVVRGTLELEGDAGVAITVQEAEFRFEPDQSTAVNEEPFVLTYDSSLYNGQPLDFKLVLSDGAGEACDTVHFTMEAGLSPRGEIAEHVNGMIAMSVSDFGQFGFAPGSIYNALGEGFRFGGGENILYEAGLAVSSGAADLATSIRDEQGILKQSDFTPVRPLSEPSLGADDGIHRTASFVDASGTVPVNIEQETVHYDGLDDQEFLIVSYRLTNQSLERISNLYFAFFSDFDLSDADEARVDESEGMIYQSDGYGNYVGVVSLANFGRFVVAANGVEKTGFGDEELMQMISVEQTSDEIATPGDCMFLMSSGPFLVDPRQSVRATMAVISGSSLAELYDNATRARNKFDILSRLSDDEVVSGADALKLYQNYPNPFNPITRISFSVFAAGHFSLEVVNILGQKVRALHDGYLQEGLHTFEWNGTNEEGRRVASGVYFYRLRSESASVSRKMMLVK